LTEGTEEGNGGNNETGQEEKKRNRNPPGIVYEIEQGTSTHMKKMYVKTEEEREERERYSVEKVPEEEK